MVLSFFRKDDEESGLEPVARHLTAMLTDARHSYDLAMSAVVAGADPVSVDDEVRLTDQRINEAEQDIRRRLMVHAAVQGSADIEVVMGYLLLSRKIERIGDQAKNILDLADEGVNLADGPDQEYLGRLRDTLSDIFGGVGALLDGDDEGVESTRTQALDVVSEIEQDLRALVHTDRPGSFAVPRALLLRYLKRIAANLAGVVSNVVDPLDQVDYPGGEDTDD